MRRNDPPRDANDLHTAGSFVFWSAVMLFARILVLASAAVYRAYHMPAHAETESGVVT